jgi:hypothetical protein
LAFTNSIVVPLLLAEFQETIPLQQKPAKKLTFSVTCTMERGFESKKRPEVT